MSRIRLITICVCVCVLAACSSHSTKKTPHHRSGARAPGNTATAGIKDNIYLPQAKRYKQLRDSAPVSDQHAINNNRQPVPKQEPLSQYGNKSPYVVNGKKYFVRNTAKGYKKRGKASWYGNKFHGYQTSNMEVYDMYKYTAANRVLPLPSYAKVTNLDNGKSVIVRVNDRGPFVDGRIVDLSYAAAKEIGIVAKGTGNVEVEAIAPASAKDQTANTKVKHHSDAPVLAKQTASGVWLQLGSFSKAENAASLVARVRQANLGMNKIVSVHPDGDQLTRVRMGPLSSKDEAERLRAQVQAMGLADAHIMIN